MDFFEQIAREQVRAMILNHARREDLSQIFSQGEMRLLGCLNAGADGRTAGELSTLLDLSTARIAAMLNNLERKGAITRARDTADRRRVVVRLTEQGRQRGADVARRGSRVPVGGLPPHGRGGHARAAAPERPGGGDRPADL